MFAGCSLLLALSGLILMLKLKNKNDPDSGGKG
jgi:hypothetical protein